MFLISKSSTTNPPVSSKDVLKLSTRPQGGKGTLWVSPSAPPTHSLDEGADQDWLR